MAYKHFMYAGIGAIAVVGAVIALNMTEMAVATQDYDMYVDPLLDQQNLFVMGRVTIQNTGHMHLTNVRVNFGDGDRLDIGTLDPGEKIIVSPPDGNPMQFVTVTADNDVVVSKTYRSPPKMVGMMGS